MEKIKEGVNDNNSKAAIVAYFIIAHAVIVIRGNKRAFIGSSLLFVVKFLIGSNLQSAKKTNFPQFDDSVLIKWQHLNLDSVCLKADHPRFCFIISAKLIKKKSVIVLIVSLSLEILNKTGECCMQQVCHMIHIIYKHVSSKYYNHFHMKLKWNEFSAFLLFPPFNFLHLSLNSLTYDKTLLLCVFCLFSSIYMLTISKLFFSIYSCIGTQPKNWCILSLFFQSHEYIHFELLWY